MKITTCKVCFAALALLFTATASASTTALTFTGGQGNNVEQNVMAGWRFQTTQSVTVDNLGVYGLRGGLVFSHQVGIWDSGGNLLATGTVPAGNSGAFVNNFWFTPVAPVMLQAGQIFTVAAFYGSPGEEIVTLLANVTTDPAITYVDRATSLTTMFSFPINNNALNLSGDFGANFTYAAATPEPASFLLLGIGLALITVGRRRV